MWTADQHRRPEGDEGSELSMIPAWSVVLSIGIFVWLEFLFLHGRPHPRPGMMPMRLLMSYGTSTAVASYALLIGYISRDVRRRSMSAGIWMLIVLVMPGGIGAIVYFLLRQPVMTRCPCCRTEVASNFHFCPQCQFQLAPVCGKCFRGVRITDAYCIQCGHDLTEDSAPARLRAYSDDVAG